MNQPILRALLKCMHLRHRHSALGYRPVKNVIAKVSTFFNRLLALRMADQARSRPC